MVLRKIVQNSARQCRYAADMTTVFLFLATVLIWGTTWIAIALQVGPVPVMVSIFYRFALAGVLFLGALALLGRLKRPAAWRFVIVQALCLFSFNFIGIYNATTLLPSGLVSVVFSMASLFNAFNARLFFGERITGRVLGAGMLGALGLALIFRDSLGAANGDTARGLLWAVFGTAMFSLGNMASRANTARGVPPVTANAWGMGIGAGVLLLLCLATGQTIAFPQGATYWAALLYLAVIGSVIGFTTYLMLVQRLGPARAGYATVVFPVVALLISTLFEGYVWSISALLGLALTGLGNLLIFTPQRRVAPALKEVATAP